MGLSITQLVWIIGVHSVLHGIFGVVLVTTSNYVNYDPTLIYTFVVFNCLLMIMGFFVFCIVVWRRPLCARIFAALFVLLALAYLICGGIYLTNYCPFYANCAMDALFYYSELECWVGPDYLMTFWHAFTLLLLLFILVWFFYALMLCKLAHCVCFIPCPPEPCAKVCEPSPCCKVKWYKKLLKAKCCPTPRQPCPPLCPPVCPSEPPHCLTTTSPSLPLQPCPQSPCPAPFPQRFSSPCRGLSSLPPSAFPSTPPPSPTLPPPSPPSPALPPPSCPKTSKKSPKFVLTLKPGKICK